MKGGHSGNAHNKKPYDRPEKSVKGKAIGAQIFANYPQPLIGIVICHHIYSYIYIFKFSRSYLIAIIPVHLHTCSPLYMVCSCKLLWVKTHHNHLKHSGLKNNFSKCFVVELH